METRTDLASEPAGTRDRELLKDAASGSALAAETLVSLYWEQMFRVAHLIVRDRGAAEDVAQETMVRAIRASAGFEEGAELRPWLAKIATNLSLDWVRDRSRRPNETELDPDQSGDDEINDGELPSLSEGLERLDATSRAMIVLRYVLDYRSGEIGAILGMPPATVRTRLRRGLEVLRVAIDDQEEPDEG